MAQRARTYAILLRRRWNHWSVWGAATIAVGAVVLPPHGIGYDLCLFHRVLDLPCLGCGLTRSVTCVAHGDLARSFEYHPFGVIVLGIALACLILNFALPHRRRRRVGAWMTVHEANLRRFFRALLLLFLAFGALRAGLVIADWWPFPAPW